MIAPLQPQKRRTVFIWNADDGTLAQEWQVGTWPYRLAFSPDGSRLLINSCGTISFGNFSALWDVSKGTQIAKLEGHKSDTQLQGAMFSHDGRRIATVSLDGSARLWDGVSGRLLDVLGQESQVSNWITLARNTVIWKLIALFSP